jgi:hypothetical protein
MRAYRDIEVSEADIHLWQQCNPVVTEALVQLTWGGPQVIYNGGLQKARLRYYDAGRRRPGLPASVAALVSSIDRRPPSSTSSTSTRNTTARSSCRLARSPSTPSRPYATQPARTVPGSAALRLRAPRVGRHRAPR